MNSEQQNGFVLIKCTTDVMFALRVLIEKCRGQELHCDCQFFVDLEKEEL